MKRMRIRTQGVDAESDASSKRWVCLEETAAETSRAATWKTIACFAAGAIGVASLANALIFARAPKIGNRLGGAFDRYPTRHGDIAYIALGAGQPTILLLHGFGVGNSSVEWRENSDALCEHFSVYALDFLGWGISDKSRHSHTSADYIEVVVGFLNDVIAEPCVVVASSGAAPIAIEAAARAGQKVAGLVLVCPSLGDDSDISKLRKKVLHKVLWMPVLGTGVYNFITSRAQIEKFARRHLYFDKSRVDAALIQRHHAAAHQSDAQFGAFAFLAGALDLDPRQTWSRLPMPALLVWGRNTQINPLETAPEWLALKPDAELAVIDDAMLLPHTEQPQRFNALLQSWCGQLSSAAGVKPSENVV